MMREFPLGTNKRSQRIPKVGFGVFFFSPPQGSAQTATRTELGRETECFRNSVTHGGAEHTAAEPTGAHREESHGQGTRRVGAPSANSMGRKQKSDSVQESLREMKDHFIC